MLKTVETYRGSLSATTSTTLATLIGEALPAAGEDYPLTVEINNTTAEPLHISASGTASATNGAIVLQPTKRVGSKAELDLIELYAANAISVDVFVSLPEAL